MINTQDQEQLLKLVAEYLAQDVSCVAIGGTAMMFMGYKHTTKDIDIAFDSEKDRQVFINAIMELGYKECSLDIYDKKRKKHKSRPLMFSRGDERFDLFVKDVFGYRLSTRDSFTQRWDFLGKKELIVHLLSAEDIILLKALTRRDKDHEDIETIVRTDKDINWELIVQKAVAQKDNNFWILMDLEETLQRVKEMAFIPSKVFERIYEAQEEHFGSKRRKRRG